MLPVLSRYSHNLYPQSPTTTPIPTTCHKRTAAFDDSDDEDCQYPDLVHKKAKTKTRSPSPAADDNIIMSPPITPIPMHSTASVIPLHRRQTSDISMEDTDLDMMDEYTNSQSQPQSHAHSRAWSSTNPLPPAFEREISIDSQSNTETEADVEVDVDSRPRTPSTIMRSMGRLEVSPTSQSREEDKMPAAYSRTQRAMHEQTHGTQKQRFTMGYRADCEKCRNKVPGHYMHTFGW